MPAVVLVTRASTDTQYYSRLLPYPRILLRRGVVIFKVSQLFTVRVSCILNSRLRSYHLFPDLECWLVFETTLATPLWGLLGHPVYHTVWYTVYRARGLAWPPKCTCFGALPCSLYCVPCSGLTRLLCVALVHRHSPSAASAPNGSHIVTELHSCSLCSCPELELHCFSPAHRTLSRQSSNYLLLCTRAHCPQEYERGPVCKAQITYYCAPACTSCSQDYERTPVGFGVALFLISRSACQDMLGRFYSTFCEW